ncbi:MAG: M1 family aminopeptidase [Caldilinea sp.]
MPGYLLRADKTSLEDTPFDPARAEAHYPPDLGLEPQHLAIDLSIDIAARRIEGAATHTVVARRSRVQTLTLDAVDLDVTAVTGDDGSALAFRNDGKQLVIRWPTPFSVGEQRNVTIHYAAERPISGLYFSQPSEAYPDMPWYAVTDHETERARHWLPCIDLPNARTTLDIRLRAEERFTILANGYLVAETVHGDGAKTVHWRLDQPCPSYLLCFAVGEFVRADDGEFDDGEKRIPVAYFCSPHHTPGDLRRSFGRTPSMLAWLTTKLGQPFPYPKYYQWAAPGVSGAMENISLVSWDERLVLDETLAAEWTWLLDAVNIHEMAHSYFGDAVVCRDYAHAWLKESWATYIEQVYREETGSQEEAQYVYYEHATAYFQEADEEYRRPIVQRSFDSSWDMYDRHLYPGGACRLHTLRALLGDDIFWPAVRDYLATYRHRVVETEDFRQTLEKHSGKSLGRFFDQWFHLPGYPDLKISFTFDDDAHRGELTIEQQQVNTAENIPIFHLDTAVAWWIDGKEYRAPLRIDQQQQLFVLPMDSMPEMVIFDPDFAVLHKLSFNPGDGLLRRQLIAGPTVLARIHAAKELAATGRYANIQAIANAYAAEPFWGVRCEMAKALAKANSAAAVEALPGLIASERHPLALPVLLRAAGAYRDAAVQAAITQRLKAGLAYVATQAAYEALGAQREDAPFDLLVNAAHTSSFNGVAQIGAIRGLAATRRAEAADVLLSLARWGGSSYYVRPAAVTALAELGKHVDKPLRTRIVEALMALLRDPVYQVAMAAVRGLGALQASEAIGALEQFARGRAQQEAVVARRTADKIRKAAKPTERAQQTQLQELRTQLRRLEEELQRLKKGEIRD